MLLPLLGCAPTGEEIARDARTDLIGMRGDDLQACAGIPTRSKTLNPRTELLSYEQRNAERGGITLSLPVLGGGFTLGATGAYCHAVVRVTDGRVTGIRYTGDTDDNFGQDGVCAPILRGCLRYPEPDLIPPPAAVVDDRLPPRQ